MKSCLICGHKNTGIMVVDKCHIKSRGSGGSDNDWNWINLCRLHHRLQHAKGFPKMMEMHPVLDTALKEKGWEVIDVMGVKKMFHPKENGKCTA